MNSKTFYKVWLSDEYCNTYPLFECVEAVAFETWLRENAEPIADFGKTYWLIGHLASDRIRDDIPYNGMGYIVKCEPIQRHFTES